MKKKYAIIVLILAGIMAWWHIYYPSGTWRYKMTVTVETPEGLKTGSAVREIYAYSHPPLLGVSRDAFFEVKKGEAVVVDLGARGVLFVLMSIGGGGGQALHVPFHAFSSPCPKAPSIGRCDIRYFSALKNSGKALLKPRHYPGMVHFKNIADPKSVERVTEMQQCKDSEKPSENSYCVKHDNFAKFFGEGVALGSIEVEMTQENITPKVNAFLPWLKSIDGYIDGQPLGGGPELSNILEKSDFIIGSGNNE